MPPKPQRAQMLPNGPNASKGPQWALMPPKGPNAPKGPQWAPMLPNPHFGVTADPRGSLRSGADFDRRCAIINPPIPFPDPRGPSRPFLRGTKRRGSPQGAAGRAALTAALRVSFGHRTEPPNPSVPVRRCGPKALPDPPPPPRGAAPVPPRAYRGLPELRARGGGGMKGLPKWRPDRETAPLPPPAPLAPLTPPPAASAPPPPPPPPPRPAEGGSDVTANAAAGRTRGGGRGFCGGWAWPGACRIFPGEWAWSGGGVGVAAGPRENRRRGRCREGAGLHGRGARGSRVAPGARALWAVRNGVRCGAVRTRPLPSPPALLAAPLWAPRPPHAAPHPLVTPTSLQPPTRPLSQPLWSHGPPHPSIHPCGHPAPPPAALWTPLHPPTPPPQTAPTATPASPMSPPPPPLSVPRAPTLLQPLLCSPHRPP